MAGVMLAWVRTLGEFGATLVVAYHPNTVPVFLRIQLTSEGLMAALPLALFLVFLGLIAVSYASRHFDASGQLIDDTVVLHEQYMAAHPSSGAQPAAPANAPTDNSVVSPVSSDTLTVDGVPDPLYFAQSSFVWRSVKSNRFHRKLRDFTQLEIREPRELG